MAALNLISISKLFAEPRARVRPKSLLRARDLGEACFMSCSAASFYFSSIDQRTHNQISSLVGQRVVG